MEAFQAFVVEKNREMPQTGGDHVPHRSGDEAYGGEHVKAGIKTLHVEHLPEGQVLVRVHYSGLNYKDALACIRDGRVVRSYPMVPGIDLAGTVLESRDPRFRPGDRVLATGYDLGVSHYGGWSELARVPADWLHPIPGGWTEKEAMIVGTAGFTAALAIMRMEKNGLSPEKGPVLVTGATGGAGSMAVALLSKRGYRVVASTGKREPDFLKAIGAAEIIHRSELNPDKIRPLEQQRWAGVIDCVGGPTLSYALASTMRGGSVAAVGLAQSNRFETTVYPFLLRGINLLGIDSAYVPRSVREQLWPEIARELYSECLRRFVHAEAELNELPGFVDRILKGQIRGRVIVKLQ